jgi:hypothetical protein
MCGVLGTAFGPLLVYTNETFVRSVEMHAARYQLTKVNPGARTTNLLQYDVAKVIRRGRLRPS